MNPLAATIAFCISRVKTAVWLEPMKLSTSFSPLLTNAGPPFKFGINCGRSPAFAPPTPRLIPIRSLANAGIRPFELDWTAGPDAGIDIVGGPDCFGLFNNAPIFSNCVAILATIVFWTFKTLTIGFDVYCALRAIASAKSGDPASRNCWIAGSCSLESVPSSVDWNADPVSCATWSWAISLLEPKPLIPSSVAWIWDLKAWSTFGFFNTSFNCFILFSKLWVNPAVALL